MILEPKHKDFTGPLQIKETVGKRFNIRRHMSIPRAFECFYFKIILNWWHSPFKYFKKFSHIKSLFVKDFLNFWKFLRALLNFFYGCCNWVLEVTIFRSHFYTSCVHGTPPLQNNKPWRMSWVAVQFPIYFYVLWINSRRCNRWKKGLYQIWNYSVCCIV